MAALISRFVNVPVAVACPARCPPQPQLGSHPSWLPLWLAQGLRPEGMTGTLLSPFFFLLSFSTTVIHLLEISPSQPPPPCVPLSYSLPAVHSVTVCFTLDHPLSHSLSPMSIKYLSPIAVSFSLAAFLSLVNSSFSQLNPLSAHSLHLPRLLSLHLNCCSSSLSLSLSHYLPL